MSAALSGFVIVDKPSGVTSFSMVSLVRRLTGVRRVGHAGTLDPLASGVLPVAIGQAARLIEYMDDVPKVYAATVRFGVSTDTYDAEGVVTAARDATHLAAGDVAAALPGFQGEIVQTPPVYSAVKVAGKPLYRYAREGTAVAVAPRVVRVDAIDLRSWAPGVAEIEVTCGKGTYIRSLAHDLGERLGCGAHLTALRRMSSGGFRIADARSPEELTALHGVARFTDAVLAPDRAVERRPVVIVEAAHTADILAGRDVRLDSRARPSVCRAYSSAGSFLGMLHAAVDDAWHPVKVLKTA